ncbi:MAG TPA: glycosyltransferase family 4 protein [candidate division Zixibacteria bacterium]|nr:glycosyltransferase family 4 protein [candidate division Zixibacteria bacterium]HER00130.1 glycosyltransferase family 4 protein [candidate division Zixibacteria bacterium]
MNIKTLKTAVIHDWLVTYCGAERALEEIINLFPECDLYSLIDFLPENHRDFIHRKKVKTSFLQRMPLVKSRYRSYLPLMPLAVEQFDLSGYDLIISNSYAVAKGVITGPDQLHISYQHSPIRYAWDMTHQYLADAGLSRGVKSCIARTILHYIRNWDARSSNGVDYFIANSGFISRRIMKCYRRRSTVIYPPVDVFSFMVDDNKEDFYLTVSRLVSYKKIGLIVEAFASMPDKRLIVIGDGPEFKEIRQKASSNIEMMGYQPRAIVQKYMQKAKAFIFAAMEDFGIVPIEAQACGTPVITFRKGGALETVIENQTGLFFEEQTAQSIARAVRRFEEMPAFCQNTMRRNALRFSKERFRQNFMEFVEDKIERFFGQTTHSRDNIDRIAEIIAQDENQIEEKNFQIANK